jgi:hypothetical protein
MKITCREIYNYAQLLCVAGLLLQISYPAAAAANAIAPLKKEKVDLLSKLYRVYPNAEFGAHEPQVDGTLPFDVRIWSTNSAEECSEMNFSPSCRGQVLYITVSESEIGGRSFGVISRKAYAWKVIDLRHRKGERPCALVVVAERQAKRQGSVQGWSTMEQSLCISPTGIERP